MHQFLLAFSRGINIFTIEFCLRGAFAAVLNLSIFVFKSSPFCLTCCKLVIWSLIKVYIKSYLYTCVCTCMCFLLRVFAIFANLHMHLKQTSGIVGSSLNIFVCKHVFLSVCVYVWAFKLAWISLNCMLPTTASAKNNLFDNTCVLID